MHTGSALTGAGHHLGQTGALRVFRMLTSLFFVGSKELPFLFISQLHPRTSVGLNGVETAIYSRKLSFRNLLLKF